MEPDLRDIEFLDKLQIFVDDTAKCSAATKEVRGDRDRISVLMKTLTPSLRGAGAIQSCCDTHVSQCQESSRRVPLVQNTEELCSTPWTRAEAKESTKSEDKDASEGHGPKKAEQKKRAKAKLPILGTAETWTQTSGVLVCPSCVSTSTSCRNCCTPRFSLMHKCTLLHKRGRPRS